MKTKFELITNDKSATIYLKRKDKKFIAYYNNEEFEQAETGDIVTFSGHQKVVDDKMCYIDMEDYRIIIADGGAYASPTVIVEKGVKVKANKILNNLKQGFTLLIVFVVIMILLFVVSTVL